MITTRTLDVAMGDGGAMRTHVTIPRIVPAPGIVLVHEIFGVNDYITGVAHRLARMGFAVLAPDLFWRIDPHNPLDHSDESLGIAFERVGRLDFPGAVADTLAALAALRDLDEVSGDGAVMGFCLGGTVALGAAVEGDPDAVVSYYGSGVADFAPRAAEVACPALFVFGTDDPFIPNEVADTIDGAFAGRTDVQVERFSAGHAFDNFLAPQFHDPTAAITAWGITGAFLARHLH